MTADPVDRRVRWRDAIWYCVATIRVGAAADDPNHFGEGRLWVLSRHKEAPMYRHADPAECELLDESGS